MTSFAWVVGFVFLEPLALVGLLAPLALLALGLRHRDGREVYLGTTRFFADATAGDEGRRKRSLPLWLLSAAAALILGVLALAGPGFEGAPPKGVVVTLVVDRSPSMYLPHESGERRMDRAWEAFERWAQDYEAEHTGAVFVSTGSLSTGPSDPVPWRDLSPPPAPGTAANEVLWAAHDDPGAVWVTDRAAASGRRFAGQFASGGAAVPGLVSLGAKGGMYWNADGTTEFREDLAGMGEVRVESAVPSVITELAVLWAQARGVRVQQGSTAGARAPELVLRGGAGTGGASVRAGRDGWEADLTLDGEGAAGLPVAAGWAPWLRGPRGEPLVTLAPGAVELGFQGLAGEPTDRAAFAVSWIELFDRARLTPNEVIEAGERQAAGSAVSIPPSAPKVLESRGASALRERQEERGAALRAVLAGAAALVGLFALVALLRLR